MSFNPKNQYYSKFKNTYNLYERIDESSKIKKKYPNKIPIICEKNYSRDNPDIDKNKYLIDYDSTIGNFVFAIRKRIKIYPGEAIFLLVGNNMLSNSSTIGDIYNKYRDIDGYLYITYSKENTFG